MKLGYTILYVDDVPATLAAWEQAFGIPRSFLHESNEYAELDTGATTLSFAGRAFGQGHFEQPDVRAMFGGDPKLYEIGFVTDDVPGAFAKAVAAGMTVVREPVTQPWGQVVGWVRDENGILVEIASPM